MILKKVLITSLVCGSELLTMCQRVSTYIWVGHVDHGSVPVTR